MKLVDLIGSVIDLMNAMWEQFYAHIRWNYNNLSSG